MSILENKVIDLHKKITNVYKQLKINHKLSELKKLQSESQNPDFWTNTNSAQETMKKIADLQNQTDPWVYLISGIEELVELVALNDTTMNDELTVSFSKFENNYNLLKKELAYNGPYDDHDVIMALFAGAGGTDAQDWAGMLLRMYTRWVELSGGRVELVEQSNGDEAGIKSATLAITGIQYGYGKLKGEHGVHRLVRLSPFNSDNLRQTSFAKVDVIPKIDKPNEVEIDENDLKIDVYRSGGRGGQSVNTTDSAVRVTHIPTGIIITIQNERSQIQNKETALTILRSRLAQLKLEQHKEHISELKGPSQSAEWGNQIRSYVLHPYKQVKDLRTQYETSDPDKILDGDLNDLIQAYLENNMGSQA